MFVVNEYNEWVDLDEVPRKATWPADSSGNVDSTRWNLHGPLEFGGQATYMETHPYQFNYCW